MQHTLPARERWRRPTTVTPEDVILSWGIGARACRVIAEVKAFSLRITPKTYLRLGVMKSKI
jgi:hypothetical protein